MPAQGIVTGSISGVIVDAQNASVPGAKVEARQAATGTAFTSEANTGGEFQLSGLPIGAYVVTITAPGFATLRVQQVAVSSNRATDIGTQKLETGAVTETVTVSASASIIESTTSQVSASFTSQDAVQLPGIGNGPDQLAVLTAGVVDTTAGIIGAGNTNGANISSNGERVRSNNFQIDGQNNNDPSVTGPTFLLANQDTIAEFQIVTNNFSADRGRNMGAIVNIITKSGGNQFHGTAFEQHTNSWGASLLNSEKDAGLTKLPRNLDNKYGFTLGGPAVRNRVWFFGSLLNQRTRQSGVLNQSLNITPTPDGLAALAAAYPGNPAINALNQIGPYAIKLGNPIPVGQVSTLTVSDGKKSLAVPFGPVARVLAANFDNVEYSLRGDWQATQKDRVFAGRSTRIRDFRTLPASSPLASSWTCRLWHTISPPTGLVHGPRTSSIRAVSAICTPTWDLKAAPIPTARSAL